MGEWKPQLDTQNRTDNIPATPGETTYNSDLYYIGLLKNGKPTTIYGLMSEFDKLMNSTNLNRYKGLGEFQTEQFKEAVMDPNTNRTFIQYTLDSAMEEIEAIRAYESNRSKILDHIDKVSRLDLME